MFLSYIVQFELGVGCTCKKNKQLMQRGLPQSKLIYRAIYAYIEKCSSDPTLNVQASCGTSCSTAGSGDAKSKAFHLVGCAP